MTGDLVELFVWMWIIATGAFAPLGYFIYKFTQKNAEPFGEAQAQAHGEAQPHSEAQSHGDRPSLVNSLAEVTTSFRCSSWKRSE